MTVVLRKGGDGDSKTDVVTMDLLNTQITMVVVGGGRSAYGDKEE